jgi:hypothetical protein
MPLTRNPQLSASLKAKLILEASQRRSRHTDTSITPGSDAPSAAAQAEVRRASAELMIPCKSSR